jgi:hypothetical protein
MAVALPAAETASLAAPVPCAELVLDVAVELEELVRF